MTQSSADRKKKLRDVPHKIGEKINGVKMLVIDEVCSGFLWLLQDKKQSGV